MIEYTDEIIVAFNKAEPRGHGINTRAPSEDLYNVDENCENISSNKSKMIHNIVSKILPTTKWARPYTCKVLAILATIVKEPNKY